MVPGASFKQPPIVTTAGITKLDTVQEQVKTTEAVQATASETEEKQSVKKTENTVNQENAEQVTKEEQTPVKEESSSKESSSEESSSETVKAEAPASPSPANKVEETSSKEKPATTVETAEKAKESITKSPVDAKSAKVETIMSKVSGRKICQSPHCLKVAKSIKDALNTSADPCDNYYEYACGNWIKEHKIPKFHSQYSRISELSENNEKTLLDSLKTDQITDNENLRKVKLFFRSCMDVKTIDKEGNGPLKDYIQTLGSWSFDKHWKSKSWNFYKTLRKMHTGYPAEVFFTVDVHTDPTKQHSTADYVVMVRQLSCVME
jgi:chemotaxis protein histidine kinase CheA